MKFVQVKNVKKQNYQGKIYDLEVIKTHTYNIDGLVVGNCSSGLHGVGSTCVNALSDSFDVVVKRDGYTWHQHFSEGNPTTEVEKLEPTKETGTIIKYHPDKKIFKLTLQPSEHIKHRLSELASLNAGLKINYVNEITGDNVSYHFEDGITGYTLHMIGDKQRLYDTPFSFEDTYEEENGHAIMCDISFIHDDETEPNSKLKSFANNINTYEGGYHLQGFKNGYKDCINQYGLDRKLIKEPIEMQYLMDGLYATISIKLYQPEFEGQTKTKLGNKEAQDAVDSVIHKYFEKITKQKDKKEILDAIVNRAIKVKEAELNARKARAISRKSKKLMKTSLPGKLADCSNKDGYTELWMCEGDSAAGSMKEGRERSYQAVLGLRGKILNVNKADMNKILNSDTIKGIVASIGGGIGKTFNIDDVRYDKIIIACFTGDTKVKLLDGTIKTFEQLVEMEQENPNQIYWVYSKNEFGDIVPGKATNPRITRYVDEYIKFTLDNGCEIKCTKDHLFMLKDGTYKEAQDLTEKDSLNAMYYCYNNGDKCSFNKNREMIYDSEKGKWEFTHYLIMKSKDGLTYKNGTSIHHINNNYLNNNPDNLIRIPTKEHLQLHNIESFKEYNKTDKHKTRIKQLHKQGVYEHTYFDNNGYNGSERQKNMLHEMNQRELVKKIHSDTMKQYNKSDMNKQSTIMLNHREDIKIKQQQGKIIKSVACLIRKNITSMEDIFNKKKIKMILVNVPSKKSIEKYFGSYEEMYKKAIEYEKTQLSENDFKKLTDVDNATSIKKQCSLNTKRNSMAKIGKLLFDEKMEFNETNYNFIRTKLHSKAPKFNMALNYFTSYEQFEEYSKNYNHKIIKKEVVKCNHVPMYDWTVEDYHNFSLECSSNNDNSALIIHQCDADVDGEHIRVLVLTLFYYYMPKLIESGRVYSAQPPLYRIIKKNNESVYLLSDSDLKEYRKKHKGESYQINRFKGLGEMNPEQLKETTMDIHNRTLRRITLEDAQEVAELFETLMGKDVTKRKQFIEANSDMVDLEAI